MATPKKNKTYFVSLAGKVPVNYEQTVEASSEKEALKIVLDGLDSDGEWAEPDWGDVELDIGNRPTPNTAGVWIEEQ